MKTTGVTGDEGRIMGILSDFKRGFRYQFVSLGVLRQRLGQAPNAALLAGMQAKGWIESAHDGQEWRITKAGLSALKSNRASMKNQAAHLDRM